jgi:hypothetical protein
VSEIVEWLPIAVVATIGLVGVAYLLGRSMWSWVEPGDPDPGGRVAPPPLGGSVMKKPEPYDSAVDLLRILRGRRR